MPALIFPVEIKPAPVSPVRAIVRVMFGDRHPGRAPVRAIVRCLHRHWSGRQGVAWSFWVNLVLLRLLIFAVQEWGRSAAGQDYHDSRAAVVLAALFFHGVVFVWQAVGVIRAAEAHLRAGGAAQLTWGLYLALILSLFWVLDFAFAAWQMTLPRPDNLRIQVELEAARAARYVIEPLPDGRCLALTGTLEIGIARQFRDRLAAHPGVERIVLTSTGGNIYQARGLASAIRDNGLVTAVETECSSACTIVFIGGVERHLAPGARLGFHQYRVDADYPVLHTDPDREQARDRAAFLEAGVREWFVDRMFDRASSGMWYPDRTELVAAGIVTATRAGRAVGPLPDIAPDIPPDPRPDPE